MLLLLVLHFFFLHSLHIRKPHFLLLSSSSFDEPRATCRSGRKTALIPSPISCAHHHAQARHLQRVQARSAANGASTHFEKYGHHGHPRLCLEHHPLFFFARAAERTQCFGSGNRGTGFTGRSYGVRVCKTMAKKTEPVLPAGVDPPDHLTCKLCASILREPVSAPPRASCECAVVRERVERAGSRG